MLKPIKNEEQYEKALEKIYKLMNKNLKEESKEFNKLEILSILVEKYEDEFHKVEPPHPIEAIKFRMEQFGLKQNDLTTYLGNETNVNEILNGKIPLSVSMLKNLHNKLGVSAAALLAD